MMSPRPSLEPHATQCRRTRVWSSSSRVRLTVVTESERVHDHSAAADSCAANLECTPLRGVAGTLAKCVELSTARRLWLTSLGTCAVSILTAFTCATCVLEAIRRSQRTESRVCARSNSTVDWQLEAWPQHLEEVEASRPARSRDVKPSHTSSRRAVGRARRAQVAAVVSVFGLCFHVCASLTKRSWNSLCCTRQHLSLAEQNVS